MEKPGELSWPHSTESPLMVEYASSHRRRPVRDCEALMSCLLWPVLHVLSVDSSLCSQRGLLFKVSGLPADDIYLTLRLHTFLLKMYFVVFAAIYLAFLNPSRIMR